MRVGQTPTFTSSSAGTFGLRLLAAAVSATVILVCAGLQTLAGLLAGWTPPAGAPVGAVLLLLAVGLAVRTVGRRMRRGRVVWDELPW